MKVLLPHIESVCEHGGNVDRVAAWLLDWLDRRSLSAPGKDTNQTGAANLTLYLCYHPYDQGFFFSSDRDEVLAEALLKVYENEKALDNQGYGNLLFDLAPTGKTATRKAGRLMLTYRRNRTPLRIEFCWHPTDSRLSPGLLGVVSRCEPPLDAREPLAASLTIKYGVEIARHLDRWQRSARWHLPVIYLPPEGKTLLLGEDAGCDLQVPNLPSPLAITYNGSANEWSVGSSGSNRNPPAAERMHNGGTKSAADIHIARSQLGEFFLRYEDDDEDYPVAFELRGALLSPPQSLIEVERQNRLEAFRLEIIGCLLPLPQPYGYGVVPADAPSGIKGRTQTAIRLPGGSWLYFDEITQTVNLHTGGSDAKRLMSEMTLTLQTQTNTRKKLSGTWWEFSTPSSFHGEVQFDQPIVATLNRGAINAGLPTDLFADYRDSTLGRSPMRIVSDDGRRHRLVFNQSAKHALLIGKKWYDPGTDTTIDLAPQHDFILGATRYQLRKLEDANDVLNLEADEV